MTFRSLIACSLVTLCLACETEQDLGDECLPLEPDAGDLGAAGSGAEPIAVAGRPVASAPADHVDNPFVGHPLGSARVGRRAGCNEPVVPACSDPSNLEGCFNPFFSGADGGEPTLEDIYGPCACMLPE